MNMTRLGIHNLFSTMTTMLCLVALSSPAQAGSSAWQLSLGAGASYAPRYDGAANNRLWLVPLVDVNYRNGGFFIGVARGIGFNFSEMKSIQYGARLLLGQARSQSADPRLNGMGDINYFPEAGLFFSSRLGPLSISSGAATGEHGTHADAGCSLNVALGKNDRFRLGATLNWGDTNYNQTYFGVTAAQAAASGNVLTIYNAAEGVKDSVLSAAWTHNFDKQWFSNTSLTHKRLQGSAELSPLTQRTVTNSLSYIVAYHF